MKSDKSAFVIVDDTGKRWKWIAFHAIHETHIKAQSDYIYTSAERAFRACRSWIKSNQNAVFG